MKLWTAIDSVTVALAVAIASLITKESKTMLSSTICDAAQECLMVLSWVCSSVIAMFCMVFLPAHAVLKAALILFMTMLDMAS